MRLSSSGNSEISPHTPEGEKRCLNSELWHACAGPLISLPVVGSRVVYFPQGHSEQVSASTNKEVDCHIPNYPNLPPQLVCQLHNVTMHADVETDEVYAQMTLQPLSPQEQKESYLPTELGISKQPTNYFCKTLTASDTSTHGGFSVPRRAAEKVFPPLDFTQQPPAQELIARDLHDNEWKFRHIFRGQPKRHLLTTGWSVFVSAKRLVAGDSVLFIWNENNQLFLGIRRSNRPQTVMPSSVLSSDSMHIGLLAAAAHASATNSRFTIFYNPRASPSEFVIPLSKFAKAVYHTRVSVGMRFRMLFETEESSVRRYMGTITGVSDLDHLRWPNSHWRSVKVGWDESTADERQPRVSLWEIEPLTTFPMYPSPFPLRLKRPWPSGLPSLNGREDVMMGLNSSSPLMWPCDCTDWRMQSLNFQGSGAAPPLMLPRLDPSLLGLQPPDMYQAMAAAALQEIRGVDHSKQMLSPSVLEFQQAQQNIPGRAVSLLPGQILQQVQSQPLSPQVSFPAISENLGQVQSHSSLHLQQKLYHQHQHQTQQQKLYHQQFPPENHHQQQLPKQQQQNHEVGQHHLSNQQMPHVVVSSLSQLVSSSQPHSTTLSAIPSYIQQPNYLDNTSSHATTSAASASPLHSILSSFSPEEASQLLNLQRSNPSDNNWVPKRIGVDSSSPLSSGVPCVVPQMGSSQTNMSQFSGRECSVEQDVGGNNNVQNNLLFGVNIDSSSLLAQNGIVNLRTDPTTMPFSAVDLLGDPQNDLPLSTTSNCLDDFPLKPPTENTIIDNVNNGTFVKVSKSGSFGRSLDITRFSSYPELRGELGRMFGLEGQLEDPLRSGWQLVFVDRENDILLVGDDPWQEFVNNVWCIKILSPTEVLHMGKQGLDPSSNPNPIRCDGFESSRRDSRNLSTGITSVGSLDY